MSKNKKMPKFRGSKSEEMAWRALDRAIFGDQNPAEVFNQMMEWKMKKDREEAEREPSLGAELKRLRKALGVTPTAAARQSGLAPEAWRNWEADCWIPTVEELGRAGEVVGRDSARKLVALRSRAPRVLLRRVLEQPLRKVARESGEPGQTKDFWRVRVENLDPLVRKGLARYLEDEGIAPTPEAMANALEEASQLPLAQQEGWVQCVAGRVRL